MQAFVFAVAVAVAVVFLLYGFPSVAAWAVGKTRRAKGMDARVFLQDRDVL